MPAFIAKKLVQLLIGKGKNPSECKVLINGITFKENVADIRNSKVAELYSELRGYSVQVDVSDPRADHAEVLHEYDIQMVERPDTDYDAIIVAVAHDEFKNLDPMHFAKMMKKDPVLIDLKGLYKRPENGITYWRL